MQSLVIMIIMTIMTIQEDPNLISIDDSMHIKIASISWKGWKIETCEPEIMKLI
jgi:hypothetical protein